MLASHPARSGSLQQPLSCLHHALHRSVTSLRTTTAAVHTRVDNAVPEAVREARIKARHSVKFGTIAEKRFARREQRFSEEMVSATCSGEEAKERKGKDL